MMTDLEKIEELKIVKEYLLVEIDKLRRAQEEETQKARNGKVSVYVVNMILLRFDDRINHLKHLLDENLREIKELKEKNNIL
jgi:hypothetical protein